MENCTGKKDINHERSINDIIDMMKDAMGNLEKQFTTDEPPRVRDEVLQQSKKILKAIEQVLKVDGVYLIEE